MAGIGSSFRAEARRTSPVSSGEAKRATSPGRPSKLETRAWEAYLLMALQYGAPSEAVADARFAEAVELAAGFDRRWAARRGN